MKATATIDSKEITHNQQATQNGHGDIDTLQDRDAQALTQQETAHRGKPESELRAAGRRPAPRPHPQGIGPPDGRQLQLPVPGQQRAQALDPNVAG